MSPCLYFTTAVVVAFGIWLAIRPPPLTLSEDPNPKPSPLTTEQISNFQSDGTLMIPGVFAGEELTAMMDASQAIANSPGILDLFFNNYGKMELDLWRSSTPFAKAAFESPLPTMANQLVRRSDPSEELSSNDDISELEAGGEGEEGKATPTDPASEGSRPLRILKDALFSYETGGEGCGWHVDDKGFWPAEDKSSGVTFWVALSNITVEEGGGLMLAPGSNNAEWASDCRAAIAGKTCSMRELSPECWDKLDSIGKSWNMQPGDVLAWERWIFHRSIPFTSDTVGEGVEGAERDEKMSLQKLRYSIRYIPDDARAMGIVHSSVQQGDRFESPYYPQAWPNPLPSELAVLHSHRLEKDTNNVAMVKFMWYMLKKTVKGWLASD